MKLQWQVNPVVGNDSRHVILPHGDADGRKSSQGSRSICGNL